MSKITSIIHIYRHRDEVYVVPLVRLSHGPWLETTPVTRIPSKGQDTLSTPLIEARSIAGNTVDTATNAWDTDIGEHLQWAEAMCALRWYEEGVVRVVPQCYRPSLEEDSEEEGWFDITEASVKLPASAGTEELVALVQRCLRL
jgi:hypothetical protein